MSQIQLWLCIVEEKQSFTEERLQCVNNATVKPVVTNQHCYSYMSFFLCTAGAFGPCSMLFEGLEIKHIEQDTLGWAIKFPNQAFSQTTGSHAKLTVTLRQL